MHNSEVPDMDGSEDEVEVEISLQEFNDIIDPQVQSEAPDTPIKPELHEGTVILILDKDEEQVANSGPY